MLRNANILHTNGKIRRKRQVFSLMAKTLVKVAMSDIAIQMLMTYGFSLNSFQP